MFIVFQIIFIYAQTTTNTCSNDPLIFKLDIRQRIMDLGDDSTISDIDIPQLCEETNEYDYIWLTQLWTPSKYNYMNQNIPQQSQDYRELETIKEYEFDPILGTYQEFMNFLQGFKQICIHMKFLGEFSFYIGEDSSLLSNKTRFLRRPQYISYNDQNQRYDDIGLVWAINSQGKTVPYTAVWNYFQVPIVMDMKDILENTILNQYQLDGVVFLQPSLGLFQVAYLLYSDEIDFYSDPKYMRDFYQIYKDINTQIYFIGDVDNVMAKPFLLNNGLQQIHNSDLKINIWVKQNYTFNQQFCYHSLQVSDVRMYNQVWYSLRHCVIQYPLSINKQCIKFNFTSVKSDSYSGNLAGIGNFQKLAQMGFTQGGWSPKKNIYTMVADGVMTNYFNQENNREPGVGFHIYLNEIFEVQFDGVTNEMIFRKSNSSLLRYQQLNITYSDYRFVVGLYLSNQSIEIAFPFQFTYDLKSPFLKINGDRHIQSIKNSTFLEIGQVLQSINQKESDTSLNIFILNMPSQSIMGVGLCNKDLIRLNNHKIAQKINSGGYMLLSNGSLIHSTDQTYDNQNLSSFSEGNVISITFLQQNYSVIFKKNTLYVTSIFIGQFVKNIQFCVGFYQQFQSVNLEY